MTEENKFIVAKENKIGKMRLFSEIDSEGYTLDRFLIEFESLQQDDSIDEIEIMINSLGGSVFKGFPIITAINNSEKPVTTIVDTVAASMAAMIFLAGAKRKMYSYSQLMIHPARYTDGSTDEALVNTNQNIFNLIKNTTKRAKDKIKSWLSKDTWFTAAQAFENSLATEIINSKMALVDSYQYQVRELVASGTYSETINNNLKSKYSSMEEILNELNLRPEATEKDVTVKVQELKNALTIKDQELTNRDSKITELEAKLDVYVQAEKKKRADEIETLVNNAFNNRQINAEGKTTWKSILEIDFDNGSKAIQALAKTEKLSDVVNTEAESKTVEVTLSPIQQMMKNAF
jgi:ATP-dependent protease ClpP protease subunit